MGQNWVLEGSQLNILIRRPPLKLKFKLNQYTTCLFPSTFFQLVKNQFLAQIGGTSQCHILTLHRFFALDHSNMSKIGPRPWKIETKSSPTCQFQSLKISFSGWLGVIQRGRGQNCPQHWGPPMGRYCHVVIVAELNIALLPWVVPLVEYPLRILENQQIAIFKGK